MNRSLSRSKVFAEAVGQILMIPFDLLLIGLGSLLQLAILAAVVLVAAAVIKWAVLAFFGA